LLLIDDLPMKCRFLGMFSWGNEWVLQFWVGLEALPCQFAEKHYFEFMFDAVMLVFVTCALN